MLVGLLVLGWVGWQYLGTNWVSERRQQEIVDRLETSWAQGEADVSAAGSRANALVRIPRFGEDFAVPLLEGTTDDVLASGIGHMDGTAGVGQQGNLVLAAHRITHGEPFAELPSLQPGDRVVIETADAIYTYVLDTAGDDLEVSFDEGWVLDAVPDNPDPDGVEPAQEPGQHLITLTTCAELFRTAERLVVFGHLASVAPRA